MIKDIFEEFAGQKLAHEIAEWCFGPNYEDCEISDLIGRWNELHEHDLFIEISTELYRAIFRMINIYRRIQDEREAESEE